MQITEADWRHGSYLIEYSTGVMREKIHRMTSTLADLLSVKVVSHRAGRWAFDERYAEALIDEGYEIDCSITPLVSWRHHTGARTGSGGPDYTTFPSQPYWIDPTDIGRPGMSSLLEVPVTIVPGRHRMVEAAIESMSSRLGQRSLTVRALRRIYPPSRWLRPSGDNGRDLRRIVTQIADGECLHAEFMLHSSELMPGGSPRFPTAAHVESLYADIERLFAMVRRLCRPATLREFHDWVVAERAI